MKVNTGQFKKGNIPLDPIKKGEHRGLQVELLGDGRENEMLLLKNMVGR